MREWRASVYNRISTLQKVLAEQHLALIDLNGSERILDIGCGDGKVTAEIAERVPEGSVLGVDPSQRMIDFARGHYIDKRHANLRFEVGDARTLPYRSEFDLIVSFNALHWVREQDQVLQSINAALKPGGRAVLEFVPGGDRKAIEEFLEDARTSARWSRHFQGFETPFFHFTGEEYRRFAETAGLRVEHLEVEPGKWDFKIPEAFAGFCRGTFGAWTSRLPDAEHEAFIADVLERYRLEHSQNGPNTFEFDQLIVDLTRPG